MKKRLIIVIVIHLISLVGYAQLEILDHLEKPAGTENRRIGAEKTAIRRYSRFRRFTQNSFNYFNFYFNANDRFDDLIKEARKIRLNKNLKDFEVAFGDEDEEYMKQNSRVLDTIIVKCKSGILLHDLRTKWTDDLLLLMGKCYFYLEKYDTAFTFFQYLNSAYKIEGEYDYSTLFVDELSQKYSIASPEGKKNIKHPPARNEALLWVARTLAAKGEWNTAIAIINLLNTDSYFPERLKPQLLHTKAFALYQKKEWSSVATVLEKIFNRDAKKKKYNLYLTKKLLLVADLYEKGYRYHDAYRVYQKVADRSKDAYNSMYAEIRSLGLDFAEQLDRQTEEIISNKKYRRYQPYMYFEIAKKLYALNNLLSFEKMAKKGLSFEKELGAEKIRLLRLMLASHYTRSQKYLLAGEVLEKIKEESITEEEKEKYNLKSMEATYTIYKAKQRVDRIDSLLFLGKLDEKKLSHFINKMNKEKREDEASSTKSEKKSTYSEGGWYFDNSYLLVKGKQEFEDMYGTIQNLDMWATQPVKGTTVKYNTENLQSKKDSYVDEFIQNIPTTLNKKLALQDSLFYAISDLVVKMMNYFQSSNDAIPYVQRAIKMEISQGAAASENMVQLRKIATLLNVQQTTDTNRMTPTTYSTSSTSSYYNTILTDFYDGKWNNFIHDEYNTMMLSKPELLKLHWLKASALAKAGQLEEARKKFQEIINEPTFPEEFKENAKIVMDALK